MLIQNCRICGSSDLEIFLDLGKQPWCNNFVSANEVGQEKTYPLEACFCQRCTTPQITYTVPKEDMYLNHLYLSGPTSTMKNHFQNVADKACKMLGRTGQVLDIGSNDGTLLRCYENNGMKTLGVDPCRVASEIAIQNGISTIINFFNFDVSNQILSCYGKFQIISAANVFYHVEDLHGITQGVSNLLDDDGIFIIQASYFPRIMENKYFDIIYHEHLLYYRIENLNRLLGMYGMEIFDAQLENVHGGSLIAYVGKIGKRKINYFVQGLLEYEKHNGFNKIETYMKFGQDVADMREKIQSFVHSVQGDIFAFGAPAKGTVLLNYCNLDVSRIKCAVEKNKLKIGKYIPCTGIPIYDEEKVPEPDYYLLLSWNFKDEFCKSPAFLNGSRKFIIPSDSPYVLARPS